MDMDDRLFLDGRSIWKSTGILLDRSIQLKSISNHVAFSFVCISSFPKYSLSSMLTGRSYPDHQFL